MNKKTENLKNVVAKIDKIEKENTLMNKNIILY